MKYIIFLSLAFFPLFATANFSAYDYLYQGKEEMLSQIHREITSGNINSEQAIEILKKAYDRQKITWEEYGKEIAALPGDENTPLVESILLGILIETEENQYIAWLSGNEKQKFSIFRKQLQKVLSGTFSEKLNSYSQEKKESTIHTVLEKAEKLKNTTSNMYMKTVYEEIIIQIGDMEGNK